MYFILPYVQKISCIPQDKQLLVAQLISVVVFLIFVYLSIKFFTFFCNKVLGNLLSRFGLKKWTGALVSNRFFIALGFALTAILVINFYPLFISTDTNWLLKVMNKLTGLFIILSFNN